MPEGSLDERGQLQQLPPLPPRERLQELLFEAARLGRADLIAPLVAAGAELEAHDAKGHTALILASYHGHREATRALLEAGALPDTADLGRGNTALMGTAFKGFIELMPDLLDAGAQVDRTNHAGQTALMLAALFGREDIVRLLMNAGADLARVDIEGNGAASLAAMQGNAAMASLLDELAQKPAI